MTPFYIGTLSNDPQQGIYFGQIDIPDGGIARPEQVARALYPNFLAVSPDRKFLYAVGNDPLPDNADFGSVSAYRIVGDGGRLECLNKVSSHGRTPCHVSLDGTGKLALVSNYGSGSLVAIAIEANGCLREEAQVIAFCGQGKHPSRQEAPHIHSAVMDEQNAFALALDLGTDRIYSYRADVKLARLSPNEVMPFAEVDGGAGPRHFAFSRCGNYGYAINELDNTINAFHYESNGGALQPRQKISTVPDGDGLTTYASEIRVHPNGRFLYAANRGHNSLSMFGVHPDNGTLHLIQTVPSGGDFPRHFAIDPSGRWLLVANERSDLVAGFEVDVHSGELRWRFEMVGITKPSCIAFIPPHVNISVSPSP